MKGWAVARSGEVRPGEVRRLMAGRGGTELGSALQCCSWGWKGGGGRRKKGKEGEKRNGKRKKGKRKKRKERERSAQFAAAEVAATTAGPVEHARRSVGRQRAAWLWREATRTQNEERKQKDGTVIGTGVGTVGRRERF